MGRALAKRCAHVAPKELAQIVVDTVERMQGQERDVISLSLTLGKFDSALQRASFFFLPNRLNVAITRARVKRIIVGSSHLTLGNFGTLKLQAWADLFQDFLSSCHHVSRLKPVSRKPRAVLSKV
ncbi:hypothetical protein J4E00_26220 [Siccationidurans soli]|uniref:DNA2/NAM7 helicase-like C-terminal domain-containing protein n=1 Tax=Hymenobacter negativus TaxID=2795026 RepID=A0ABS3QMS9_9BACT|nr:hypothetical protein [Hymenobacter negativus]